MEEVSGTITTTTANEIKAFTANVFEIGGACGIILMWSHPSLQVKQVIPASAFVSTPNTNPNSPICYDVSLSVFFFKKRFLFESFLNNDYYSLVCCPFVGCNEGNHWRSCTELFNNDDFLW